MTDLIADVTGHQESTLQKVWQALEDRGISQESATQITQSILNAGILFREPIDFSDSNLVAHAERELELVGEESWIKNHILDLVKLFSSQGHSGFSASHFTQIVPMLWRYENLKPLTDDPDDWMEVTDNTWQSTRNPKAFSEDNGKTYYEVDNHPRDGGPTHKTEHKVKSD